MTRRLCALLPLLAMTARPLAAQDPKPDAAKYSNSGAAFLPLQRGTAWTWRVERRVGEQQREWLERAVVWGDVPHPEGGVCAQVLTRADSDDAVSAEYWRADATGIHRFDNAYTWGIRGVRGGKGTRILPAPVGAETSWQWEASTPVQTEAGHRPDPDQFKERHSAELLGVDEEVNVAAGTFRCVHLRHRTKYTHWLRVITRDIWFGRGAGVVKETQSWDGGSQTKELQQFQAGLAKPVDRAGVAKDWLAKSSLDRNSHDGVREAEIEWLPAGEEACYVRGRFAIVRHPALQQQSVLYADDTCTGFQLCDKEFWAAQWPLARAVPPELGARPAGSQNEDEVVLSHFAYTVARLEALRLGLTEDKTGGSHSESTVGGNGTMASLSTITAKAGEQRQRLTGTLECSNGTITKVDVKVDAAPAGADRAEPPRRR